MPLQSDDFLNQMVFEGDVHENELAIGSRRQRRSLSTCALAQMGGGQFTKMVTAHSGAKKMVAHHHSSQFQGNMVPYSIKPLTNPKNGTISIERGPVQTRVFYQSRKGFVGQDSFQFVRVSNDVYGGTYTVAVTVR